MGALFFSVCVCMVSFGCLYGPCVCVSMQVRNTMHQANDEDRSRSWLHRQTQKQSGEFIEFDYS